MVSEIIIIAIKFEVVLLYVGISSQKEEPCNDCNDNLLEEILPTLRITIIDDFKF